MYHNYHEHDTLTGFVKSGRSHPFWRLFPSHEFTALHFSVSMKQHLILPRDGTHLAPKSCALRPFHCVPSKVDWPGSGMSGEVEPSLQTPSLQNFLSML